ncbi:hypothetical protein [Streptomyces uncialis]|uniref:Membrane protein n=1 Tax=Streptomyces uncialis TaxID=1048205 RepID=A0A1Q4V4Y7_9ACTN|nr:hypothetical protein [Streptomyces uncialis]MCX4663049.1 hypothetical protein [Streptomyces uncialis]OKH92865.1 membrane protein [Streptomyces uncialis]WST71123.1 hypothetical protein OG268_29040 [Streptomyces uncialis]WTE10209.1 hypothetical protein OG924_07790 [Streptomyces uncialis]
MKIDWVALGTVFGVSLVATVALVGLFTLGIVGLSKRDAAVAANGGAKSGAAAVAATSAYASFALCVAAVSYGIYLIVI